jgi:hypothetical protein
LKIAAKCQPVPVILNPHRDKVPGLHLDDAINGPERLRLREGSD